MFEITITETATEKQTGGNDWAIIGKHFANEKDLERSIYASRNELRDKVLAGSVVLFEEYGYTPKYEKQVEVKREIFKQIVKDLNLVAVINAINGSH